MEEPKTVYDSAVDALRKVFNDTSHSKEDTIRDLKSLKDEIDVMLDSLKE